MVKPILLTICLFFCSQITQAQGLVALIDNALVALNDCNGEGVEICKLKTTYPSNRIYQLAFNQRDRLYYSILDGAVTPTLVAFDSTGTFYEIGPFTEGFKQLGLVESIAFNSADGSILIGGSINGPSVGDYFSETIFKVNPRTAECTRLFDISYQGIPNADLDGMDVYNGYLYSFDGLPNENRCRIYRFDLTQSHNVPAAKIWAEREEYLVQGYDLAIDCETVVYCHSRGKKSFVSMKTPFLWEDIGTSHHPDDHNGDIVHGLVRIGPIAKYGLSVANDTMICASGSFQLEIQPKGFCDVLWNTGELGESISIGGSGIFYAKLTDGGCLTYTDTVRIEIVNNQISLSRYRNKVLCAGDSIVLYPTGRYESLLWSDGSVGDSLIVKSPGFYSVSAQWKDCEFRSENLFIDAVNGAIIVSQQDTTLCAGETITLIAEHSFLQPPIWSNGQVGNSIIVTEAGNYTASVLDKGCLISSEEVKVNYYNIKSSISGNPILCPDSFSTLSIIIPNDGRVLWSNGSIGESIQVSQPGQYFAEITQGECVYTTDTFFVSLSSDYASILQGDTTICRGNSSILTLVYSELPERIAWSDGRSGASITVSQPGFYRATVLINGCVFETEPIELTTIDCPECKVYFPNVFSPNGDGVNDEFSLLFNPTNCQIQQPYLQIFDRWGAMVFEGPTETWDGKFKGRFLNPGNFTYTFSAIGSSPKGNFLVKQFGDVTIVR